MDPVIYSSERTYVQSVEDQVERINRIGAIIRALENLMINAAAGTADLDEYSLDDGQTKIRTKYRDVNAIASSIKTWDNLQQMLIARLNNQTTGRVIRLVDGKNFI